MKYLIWLGGVAATLTSLHGAMTAESLRCEFLTNPPAIDAASPRLGWVLSSEVRGAKQSAYQILVASTAQKLAADQGDLWDSGKVTSSEQNQIAYGGAALSSDETCFWKVRAWDKEGNPGSWSTSASWTMGLLHPEDWKAHWIGKEVPQPWDSADWIWESDLKASATPAAPVTVTKTFQVPSNFNTESARLFISSYGPFKYTLNGKEVSGSDATVDVTIPERVVGQYDVGPQIVPGANTLGITVTDSSGPVHGVKVWLGLVGKTNRMVVLSNPSWTSGTGAAKVTKNLGGLVLGDRNPEVPMPVREFRKKFIAKEKPIRARLWITSDNWEEPWLNGARVGQDLLAPDPTYLPKHVQYLVYDVTDAIVAGDNALGVIASDSDSRTITSDRHSPSILAQLRLDYADGTSQWVITDRTWKFTTDGPIRSASMYDGERYDAQREDAWTQPNYDDSAWEPVRVVKGPAGVLIAKTNPPIRIVETLKPVAITQPLPGHYIFDFGKNISGWCRLHVSGPAGTTVTLRHAEELMSDGTLWTANLQGAAALDSYTLSGKGAEIFEPRLTYHGFRYAEITGFPGTPDASALEACLIRDDLPATGEFASSDDRLNRYWDMVRLTLADNYKGVPVSCDQRGERDAWLGDRAFEEQNEPWFFDGSTTYESWFRDIRDTQGAHGEISPISPHQPFNYFPDVVWASGFITMQEQLLIHYGDMGLLRESYPAMKAWADGIASLEKDDVLSHDMWSDWASIGEEGSQRGQRLKTVPRAILSDAAYIHALRLLARYARLLQLPEDATAFDAHADRMTAAFNRTFLSPSTHTYENGGETSFILPVAFGLVPPEDRDAVAANFVQRIKDDDNHTYCGIVGLGSVMQALVDIGRPDLPYALASQDTAPSWGMMVMKGATTFWEFYNDAITNSRTAVISHNHPMMMGDLGDWLVEQVAGLQKDPDALGFRHFTVAPDPQGGVTWASMTYQSLRGPAVSSWKLNGGVLTLEVKVPANATATVLLPAASLDAVTESGMPAAKADGITSSKFADGHAQFEVGSGDYHFSVAKP